MAVPIIDISRKEVERWISAGTLGLTSENRYFRVSSDDEYYLVALTAVYATRWDAIWIPNVIETSSSLEQVEDWSRTLEDEELSELCGKMVCHCFEVWHVVDDFDYEDFENYAYYEGAYSLRGILYDIASYECACRVLETSKNDDEIASALELYDAFKRSYDISYDLMSFYPVTIYKRKLDYVLDLEELRLAGSVENA